MHLLFLSPSPGEPLPILLEKIILWVIKKKERLLLCVSSFLEYKPHRAGMPVYFVHWRIPGTLNLAHKRPLINICWMNIILFLLLLPLPLRLVWLPTMCQALCGRFHILVQAQRRQATIILILHMWKLRVWEVWPLDPDDWAGKWLRRALKPGQPGLRACVPLCCIISVSGSPTRKSRAEAPPTSGDEGP